MRHPFLITYTKAERWLEAAKRHARGAAADAATWTTSGTVDPEAYRMALAAIEEGDGTDGFLPQPPNLSGEYADGPTPAELVHEITGYTPWGDDSNGEFDALADEICNAWEEEIGEVFETYCEIALRKALGLDQPSPERTPAFTPGQVVRLLPSPFDDLPSGCEGVVVAPGLLENFSLEDFAYNFFGEHEPSPKAISAWATWAKQEDWYDVFCCGYNDPCGNQSNYWPIPGCWLESDEDAAKRDAAEVRAFLDEAVAKEQADKPLMTAEDIMAIVDEAIARDEEADNEAS